jgi:hypothetical protein
MTKEILSMKSENHEGNFRKALGLTVYPIRNNGLFTEILYGFGPTFDTRDAGDNSPTGWVVSWSLGKSFWISNRYSIVTGLTSRYSKFPDAIYMMKENTRMISTLGLFIGVTYN